MELIFDHQRISFALETRLNATARRHKTNLLQMWLLLLLQGSLRKTMRGRRSLSADECAAELCIMRTRVSNELGTLVKRKLARELPTENGGDKRGRRVVLTAAGENLAHSLHLLLQTLQKDLLTAAGLKATDRAIEPQCVVMGLWLTGHSDAKLPTLPRVLHAPETLAAGARRGIEPIRLKKLGPPKL